EVRDFITITSYQLITDHSPEFVVGLHGEPLDVDAFPTVKSMGYTVFHKFYNDRSRRATKSDAFDVLIASALPHVEAFVTERNQADKIRQMQSRDSFLQHLNVIPFGDMRDGTATH